MDISLMLMEKIMGLYDPNCKYILNLHLQPKIWSASHLLIYILDHLLLIWNTPQSIISLLPPYGDVFSQPQNIITSYGLIVLYSYQPQVKPLGCLIRGGTFQVSDYHSLELYPLPSGFGIHLWMVLKWNIRLTPPIYGWFRGTPYGNPYPLVN